MWHFDVFLVTSNQVFHNQRHCDGKVSQANLNVNKGILKCQPLLHRVYDTTEIYVAL